ncbi:MAG: Maf family protein [Eubacteriales bacterium]|nr:Maf family protein [Eubacteriales bacterium]
MAESWAEQPLVLASGSPRRLELMRLLGVPFEAVPSQADETAYGNGAERVRVLALRKAEEVAARMPQRIILAADTLVCVEEDVLGKPKDQADACRMLRRLSGRAHQVFTGVCMITPGQPTRQEVCATTVHFVPLSDEVILRYVATGEPMDKAGAYAIQERAGAFVSRIEGSPTNVIGLPMETVARFVSDLSIPLF